MKNRYTLGEEIFNSVSHGVGTALACAGIGILILLSGLYGSTVAVVSSVIYGISLLLMFTSSTLYHSLTHPMAKRVLRILDHCAIFVLIAGTYTPFMLITLKGPFGYTLFLVVWAAAVLGIILNSVDLKKYEKLSLVCYVAMGWVVVVAIRPLYENLAFGGLVLLALGGLMYTGGIVFYVMKKYRYMHSIWHLFVLAGAVLHYISILCYVIPSTF